MDQVVAPPLPATPEEFLAWEELQEERHEFDGLRPVPMNGGTREHATIAFNIANELRNRLRGSSCRVGGETIKIAIGPVYRYADASVTCTPVPRGSLVVPEPIVLFEVASPSSGTIDHVVKRAEYCALPSLQHYVLVEQQEVRLTVHVRGTVGWTTHTLAGGEVLHLPGIGVSVPVDDLYQEVFPPP